mgnify:CR=1 FL=1
MMATLTRFAVALSLAVLLQACTAASGIFDNNCSGNGWVKPSGDYCSAYTTGATP